MQRVCGMQWTVTLTGADFFYKNRAGLCVTLPHPYVNPVHFYSDVTVFATVFACCEVKGLTVEIWSLTLARKTKDHSENI